MTIPFDAATLDARLRARPTLGEVFALALAVGMMGIFLWHPTVVNYDPYFDYQTLVMAARGNFQFYFYGYWLVPIFALLDVLPLPVGYAIWCGLGLAGIFFAARVFGGNTALAVASYQMFYSLFLGQSAGVIVGGLALCWWGLIHRRWHIAGWGLALAGAKYQLGLTGGLILLGLADIGWRDRLRVLIVPTLVVLISLVVYPLWPLEALTNLQTYPPWNQGSIALWRWIGPWALLFWLPPLLLPLPRERRFMALAAASALGLPYFQQTDLLFLFTLPVGWPILLGNLGYFFAVYQWVALQALAIVPLVIYTLTLGPAFVAWFTQFAVSLRRA